MPALKTRAKAQTSATRSCLTVDLTITTPPETDPDPYVVSNVHPPAVTLEFDSRSKWLAMKEHFGIVEAIHIAAGHGEMPHPVASVVAHAGRGLEGDRNFDDSSPDSCEITLIEAEAFDRLSREHGLDLPPAASRRQVLVRGATLADFIGRRFEIGEIECVGDEHCEPCSHLVKLVGTPVVLNGLLHTGLRGRITRGGTIHVGDTVQLAPETLHVSADARSEERERSGC